MAQYSAEQLFGLAQAKYDECEAIINEISTIVKGVQEDFDPKVAMICFDLIIQACLLNASVQDGELEHNEKVFVQNITKHGDLLSLVNSALKEHDAEWIDVEWDDIGQFQAETQQQFAQISAAVVDPYAETFAGIFGIVDKVVTEKDYMNLLYDAVGTMFVALAGIDGDDIDTDVAREEGCLAFAIYDTMVNDKWKKAMEQ